LTILVLNNILIRLGVLPPIHVSRMIVAQGRALLLSLFTFVILPAPATIELE